MQRRLLKRARRDIGISQRGVAVAAGLSERTVRRAEKGIAVSRKSIVAICANLGVDVARLDRRADVNGRREWTPDDDAVAIEMWQEGLPAVEVARELGVTRNAVAARMIRMGIRYEERRRRA